MKRHALFVGVDKYADGHIPNLSCAVSDATDLHGFFKYGAGYDRVELLPNPAGKKDVLGMVRELTSDLNSGDFFLFFFAGHGFRVGENHVLVCSNDLYDDVKYEDDGLPLGQLKRRLSGAFDSALLLDACQSDILATRGGEGIAERDLSLILDSPAERPGCGALTVVTSCDAGQTAAELSEGRHGLFTMAMLDLLKEAQGMHARLDLSDAFRMSLGRRMGEIAARSGLSTEQRPRFSCTGDACFVLLDGVASASSVPPPSYHQAGGAPTLVTCPVCLGNVRLEGTHNCDKCGKKYVCADCWDREYRCCSECAGKVRKEAEECRRAAGMRLVVRAGSIEVPLRWCPAGTFTMGSPTSEEGRYDDEVQHRVTLTRGFWMGETEVTQGLWKKVMGGETIHDLARKALRDDTKYNLNGKMQTLRELHNRSRDAYPSSICGDLDDDVPVYHVNWQETTEFCARLTAMARQCGTLPEGCEFRLPTEAQWEYACRAVTKTALPNGCDIHILGERNAPALDNIAWYGGNSSVGFNGRGWDSTPLKEKQYPGGCACARAVGTKNPNMWGLYDMIGNVWEWCADWFGNYPSDSVVDPTGPAAGKFRVLRGGCWCSLARRCRSASRFRLDPGNRSRHYGLRLCCSAGPRMGGVEQ